MVAGTYTEKNIVAAAEDGRIVQIASLQGAEVKINVARLMMKRVVLTGSTLPAAAARCEGRDRGGAGEERVAADRRGQDQAGDGQDVPANSGG